MHTRTHTRTHTHTHNLTQVLGKSGELVDLADSPLAGNVRIFTDYDPEWEIEPAALNMLEKIGGFTQITVVGELSVYDYLFWSSFVHILK